MPKSQQVAKIRQILSNRGAGVDTLDLVDDLVDPTVGYEDNKREILMRVGFDTDKRYGEREMVHAQCPSAIADCATNGIDACEFACEECRDTPSCRKLTQKAEPLKKKVVKITKPPKQKEDYFQRKRLGNMEAVARMLPTKLKHIKELETVDPKYAYAKTEKAVLQGEIEEYYKEFPELAKKFKTTKKKVVEPTKTIKPPKVTKKHKVTTKPKKPTPTPVTKSKSKSKFHEKVLTDAQIQHARKHGYVHITIEGVKKRVSKKNFAARKRTIYWYKSGGKVSLKVVRR